MSYRITITANTGSFVASAGQTLLDAALKQGQQLPYGCRNGECGACKARVVSGKVTHNGKVFAALTAAEQREGWCLVCQARAESDVTLQVREVDRAAPLEARTLPARVARVEQLSHDVLGIWLKLPQNERLAFRAGQYIEVLMQDGKQRHFSLANAPHDDEFLQLHVRYFPGGALGEFSLKGLHEKEQLRIRGPYGTFALREESTRPLVLVAGGTGFAPLKAILEHAFAKGVQQPIRLYWGVRAKRDLYSPLPEQWGREHPNFSFVPVLSESVPEEDWHGRRGLVHEAVAADYYDLSDCDVYVSGPPVMVKAVAQVCAHRGLPPERMYSDAFEHSPK
jgi:CDP-4-dehydro-6-deoxyglucose reductase